MIIIDNYMTEDLGLGGSDLLVYGDIVSNMNSYNECLLSQQMIAKHTGLSVKTVRRTIGNLKAQNLISVKIVKDGNRPKSITTINNKQLTMIMDEDFNNTIKFWNSCIGFVEDINQRNYTAYKRIIQDPDYCQGMLKEAIMWYGETIRTKGYYKTYIYKFEKFANVWKNYIIGGYEQVSFMTWIETATGCNGYKPYDPDEIAIAAKKFEHSIPDEMLGQVDM